VLAALLAAGACSSSGSSVQAAATNTPAAAATTDACGNPTDPSLHIVATAARDGELAVFPSPGATTTTLTLSSPKLVNDDPNAPVPRVLLVTQAPADNCAWVEVSLPVRPNGSTGWVKRDDVTLSSHPYRIVASLGAFDLKVYQGDEVVLDAPIAVAEDDTPTPGGTYYTTELLKPPDPEGDYGPYAYGLSGYSEKLQSFNGGNGQLGIHGTNHPERIGTKVSHGCIRMRNEDITTLAEKIQLPLGVPVQIVA